IQSRCAVFRFAPLSDKDAKKYLQKIIKNENIQITPEGIDAVIYASEGDLRRSTNILQSAAITGKEITDEEIFKATGKAQPQDIRKMIKLATTGAFIKSRKLLLELLIKQGLSAQDIIKQIHREAVHMTDIDDKTKVEMIKMIGEVDFRLTEGSNPEIQLSALLAHLVGLNLDS
ncbi:MAG: replication factor C small subunit, partial [Candidatus Heimdallarchaeota archaeon]